jgi:uncharacterized protein YaeQ
MKNSWSLLNQGNTIRILLLLIFIIDVHPLLSNPLCYQMYQDRHLESNLSALSPILSSTAKLFGIPTAEQGKIVESYSDRSLRDIRDEVKAKEEVIEQIKKLPPSHMAELKDVIQKLVKSGFLLSPFHEILFLNSIGLSQKINDNKDPLVGLAAYRGKADLQKSDLNGFSRSLHGSTPDDMSYRQTIAKKMFDYPYTNSHINIIKWKILSEESRVDLVSEFIKNTRLKMKIPDLIKIIDSLSEIDTAEKGKFLMQVLELTLPDIFAVSRARARGLTDKSLAWVAPSAAGALLGFWGGSEILTGSNNIGILWAGLGGLLGHGLLPTSSLFQQIPRIPGRMRSAAIRFSKRYSIEQRLLDQARAEKDGLASKEQKLAVANKTQNPEQDAKLDLAFNAIKLELKNRKLQGPIEISKWGSEFQNGITNLVERGQLLSSRVKKASENSKELQTESLNDGTSASQRNQLRSSLNSQINFINDSLLVAFSMKADLLSLSAALDRYNELASQITERNLTSSEKNILELTTRNLSSYKMQISAIATLLVNSEQAMINELNIAQMNLLGINDERLIKSF